MAQPTKYERQYGFSGQPAAGWAEGISNELNAVKVTTDETIDNLELIQRDDGALRNGIVTQDSLAPDLAVAGLVALNIVSEAVAIAAEDNTGPMSSLRTKQQIDARLASQATAEAGVATTGLMNELRTKQSIDVNAELGDYTQTGTGAVVRPIRDRLRDTIHAADYGVSASASAATNTAKLQGIIDDWVASAASAGKYNSPGAKLVLPRGQIQTNASLDVTAAHGLTIEGQGFGATELRGTADAPIIYSSDLVSDPLSYFNLLKMTIRGPGRANTSAHGVQLGANNACEINVRVWSCRRAISLRDSFETELTFNIDGLGDLSCYNGLYLEDGTAGTVENAVHIKYGYVYGCENYGFRGENVVGTNIDFLHILGCTAGGAYIGESPSGKTLKWFHWADGLIDTCGFLLIVKTAVGGELINIGELWLSAATADSPIQLDGLEDLNFTPKNISSVRAGPFINGCTRANVDLKCILDYDNNATGANALIVQNSSDGVYRVGTAKKASGATSTTAVNEAGTSARNVFIGGNVDGLYYTIPGNGSRTVGVRHVSSSATQNLPDHVAEFTVATLPPASTFWQGRMIAVTDEIGGYTLAFCDGTNWRRVQDRAVVS